MGGHVDLQLSGRPAVALSRRRRTRRQVEGLGCSPIGPTIHAVLLVIAATEDR